jgi:hypothetical protein
MVSGSNVIAGSICANREVLTKVVITKSVVSSGIAKSNAPADPTMVRSKVEGGTWSRLR